jgi:murein endopeptidase
MHSLLAGVTACLVLAACVGARAQAPPADPSPPAASVPPAPSPAPAPAAPARPSRALGLPWYGRLRNGVQLPEAGPGWLTWDPVFEISPNRPWRRWGTQALVATVERVLGAYQAAHPDLPPVLVGDLSRPHGGIFDRRFGGLGHASHQNGRDADIYYPRRDRALLAAFRPRQIDRSLAQELVNRFVAAGAQFVFVGPHTHLRGPRGVVQVIRHHDDHLHVRIFDPDPVR